MSMVRQVLKKACGRCGKPFFTYELEKTFCTNTCEVRFKYDKHFQIKDYLKKNTNYCENCNEFLDIKGSVTMRFCDEHCKRQFDKKQRAIASEGKPKQKKKGIPYEVLNMIEEKKRVFDDHDWLYKKNRDRI
jgi:hypothetical protein